jgi:thiamine pyrophosphokinase
MKRVVICSGGPKEEVVDFKQLLFLEDEVVFIGADRGALHLIENGIIPNEIIGDFDSLLDDEFRYLEQKVGKITKLQAKKDETDTHIAVIQALTYKPDQIILTAVTGGRLDHYEAVLHDMFRFQMSNPDVIFSIQNKQNMIRFLLPGTHLVEQNHTYKYISFFSFGEAVEAVWLSGFLYEVTSESIMIGNSKFTSNEVIGQTSTISFTKGICLMIRSSD